ncbi:NDP-sugar epimerase, includes UDP-GlcNAc-inverting 4,6-dehydratase FlaA1 and capsular polysaccharide biosynthesis protein EpsC [Evansella caseinilytica]|uniref:NDP-sugar epimerase, includes UDP-GlcNAc-inverting 4,6-dehydratase FlaA1 and capsular polysaccharide biosynthesis protein EpsC n=1 Tax=Evansella caseinilytica TaxID=1503961 RepID=A0A1H3UMK7_9BACI|nr:nucleoside-diphosphate sugar epimerase/dehydratase [Evansella caseinilytica]SDZ63291.1 NDP-sugar epimerase, includes UDP-GlcNAc-inverting 4,6-dehydratase FlaA1 and capsular polysaccharide biosynthesis protein EpsC [Evansella caseinilytica]
MPYRQRITFLILIDSLFIITTILVSSMLLYETILITDQELYITAIALLVSYFIFSVKYKLYKKVWEYASIGELTLIIKIVGLSILTTFIIQQLIIANSYLRFLIIICLLELLFIGGSRFSWRVVRDMYFKQEKNKKRTLIIGAGSAGIMVTKQLFKNKTADLLPVAFIDDDTSKHRLDILGIPVVGGITEIERAVNEQQIDNIVIAIPSLNKTALNNIIKECAKTSARTQIIPMLEDIVAGRVSVNQFRDVQVEDLLGREPVELDIDSISGYISNKVVLITGAGGSIGSEICRQVTKFNPQKLILLGHGENSIYTIEMELKELYKNHPVEFITEIADIQDSKKMIQMMTKHAPDVVYHAAAHKHVPLMERNPEEAVKNNIIGTMNVAKAASLIQVKTFVMISSDKAVNPTSVMGATKRLAEMIIQDMNRCSKTKFIAVRFGNVLGSRGSVIPLFKKQIQNGGPVTVTHPEMVRYFMTIPEASRLVIQAGSLAKGGEIFVLDMGEPVKIVDLARKLIKLSGYTINEIGINFTGIRQGEKLYEELLNKNELQNRQIFPHIYVGKTTDIYMNEISDIVSNFERTDRSTLRSLLIDLANKQSVSTRNTANVEKVKIPITG